MNFKMYIFWLLEIKLVFEKWQMNSVKSLSRAWLLATPGTAALPGSSIHGFFQARVLEWVAIAFITYLRIFVAIYMCLI